jgi:hypothetical protein
MQNKICSFLQTIWKKKKIRSQTTNSVFSSEHKYLGFAVGQMDDSLSEFEKTKFNYIYLLFILMHTCKMF